jgi:hypothetical protein
MDTASVASSTPAQPPVNILAILNELATGLGRDTVHTACLQFVTRKRHPREKKKERKPRGKSSWNLEVDRVLAEMRADAVAGGMSEEGVLKTITYRMAMTEAGRRRREGSGAAPAAPAPAAPPAAADAPPAHAPVPIAEVEVEAEEDGQDTHNTDDVVVDGVPSEYDPQTIYRFLFDLQESGRINMLACNLELQNEFGMTRTEANTVRDEYCNRYDALKKKYGVPAPPPVPVAQPKTPARRPSMPAPNAPKKALPASRSKIPIA